MASVFISHGGADKKFARRLTRDLQAHGHEAWLDEDKIQIGDSIIQSIGDAIQEVDFVLVLISASSIESEWVQQELRIAISEQMQGNVAILPALLEKVSPPAFLGDKKYADFRDSAAYDREFKSILRRLRRIEVRSETIERTVSAERSRISAVVARQERMELIRLAARSGLLDAEAEKLEGALLEHLRTTHGLSCQRRRGTNSAYYVSTYERKEVAFSVVGRMKNTSTPPGFGVKWLLRVEEGPPLAFADLFADFFEPGSRFQRTMSDGRLRCQWKSTDFIGGLDISAERK